MTGGGRLQSAQAMRLLAVLCAAVLVAGVAAVTVRPPAGSSLATRSPRVTTTTVAVPATVSTTTTAPSTTTAPLTTTTTVPTTTPPSTPPPTAAPAPPRAVPVSGDGAVLLVWTSGGLPPGFAADVASIPTVSHSTVASGDLIRLAGTDAADGTAVERVPDGWAIPIDAFAVDPAGYAAFAPEPDRSTIASLAPGRAVLSRSSALLRGVGVGATLHLGGGSVTVHGIVADESVGGAEVVVHRDDAARLGIDDERFLLLTDTDRAATEAEIRRRTPSGEFLSLRTDAQARWLRHGDRVEPQALVKRTFGEFRFQDASGRDIRIDPAWVDANIATTTVPLLGRITCHRAVIPAVRAAMEELERTGQGHTVQPENYAGCYHGRRIAPGSGLSRHSWGIALDLNISGNPRGTYESQDPALVQAMTSRGFAWGGEWEYPDPGHYEFVARPDA